MSNKNLNNKETYIYHTTNFKNKVSQHQKLVEQGNFCTNQYDDYSDWILEKIIDFPCDSKFDAFQKVCKYYKLLNDEETYKNLVRYRMRQHTDKIKKNTDYDQFLEDSYR